MAGSRESDPIASGSSLLLRTRDRDGLWRDFSTLAGPGSDWVTGFVVHACLQGGEASVVAPATLTNLARRQRAEGGWGYNSTVPCDCDSTAWGLLALISGGCLDRLRIARARTYIASHQAPSSGGFSTYGARGAIGAFIDAPTVSATRGWTAPHPCVSGVALQALLAAGTDHRSQAVRRGVAFLEGVRDGLWSSYWWTGHAYATCQALSALGAAGARAPRIEVEVRDALTARQGADGGFSPATPRDPAEPFETAFALLTLVLCGARGSAAASAAASWLAAWSRSIDRRSAPMLRIPPPMVRAPESLASWRSDGLGTGVVIRDQRCVFTTAAVIWALAAYRRSG